MPELKHAGRLATGVLVGLVACCAGEALALPFGWSCVGSSCGSASGVDGDVTAPPGGGAYDWITTWGGQGLGSQDLGLGEFVPAEIADVVIGEFAESTGTIMRSFVFSANAGDTLDVDFNYITSDTDFSDLGGYADYAWARLLDQAMNPVALLFTVRTSSSADNTVPGALMPVNLATVTPGSTPILPGTGEGGGPLWSPLDTESGQCATFTGAGCGQTDWLSASYQIAASGSYRIEFGVVNWYDEFFNSGLAVSDLTLNGDPLADVPEPGSLALFGSGLVLAARRLRLHRRPV